ncbi:MAG: transposase zinc-binding domain-containing protein [Opitutaceae bacterium]
MLHDHAAKRSGLSTAATSAIAAFLRCGDLHAGFTRFHCPDCDHEFLLAFSCKQRAPAPLTTNAAHASRGPSSPTPSATSAMYNVCPLWVGPLDWPSNARSAPGCSGPSPS